MTGAPVLETERLALRRPEPRDLDAFTAFFTSERAGFVGGGAECDAAQAWRSFATHLGHWRLRGYGCWVVTEKGEDRALGLVGPWSPADWPEAEIAWSMFPEGEGRGFAAEAARSARACVYERFGWRTAVSYVDPGNARSRRLAERLGCAPDAAAAQPFETPVIVYRHPGPEAAS